MKLIAVMQITGGGRRRVLTHPVWDEGMPPDPISLVKSHLRSLYQYVNSLSVCAITNARTAATQGLRNAGCL